eukprot:tig00000553_g2108.t1
MAFSFSGGVLVASKATPNAAAASRSSKRTAHRPTTRTSYSAVRTASTAFGASQLFGGRTFTAARAQPAISFSCVAGVQKKYGTFEDLLAESDSPLLVDFFATWCGPCQMLAPMLAEMASQMSDKVRVVKIDTDMYPTIASKFQIRGLPTLILFKGGKPVDRIEGVLPKEELFAHYEALLKE